MKPLDLLGRHFERLTVVARHGTAVSPSGTQRATWLCRCECGNASVVRSADLVRGTQLSCGCLKVERTRARLTTHGHTTGGVSPEYTAWHHAKRRCFDAGDDGYKDYGGRGITMCDRWREDFRAFIADMGRCPVGLELDRIDVNGHYEPGNCRWTTRIVQANNKRWHRYVDIDGQRMTVAQAARAAGVSAFVVYGRLNRGWPIDRALRAVA